jgi:hypothetical protein
MVRHDELDVTFEALQRMARLLKHSAARLDESARAGARLRGVLAGASEHAGTRRAHDELETAHRHLVRAGAELHAYGAEVDSRYRRLRDSQGGARAAQHGDPDPHPRPFGHPTPEQRRLRQIDLLLRHSALGRLSLNERARWNIHLRLTPRNRRGSYYDERTNTIYIDRRMGRRDRALTFVHEMVHANYDATNRTAVDSAGRLSRRTFVDRMLREEVRASVREIRAEAQLEAEHADDPDVLAAPNAWLYREAGNAAIQQARRDDRLLTPQELNKIGREAGAEAVLEAYRNGDARTSNTNQPYTEYYGRYWDRVHRG